MIPIGAAVMKEGIWERAFGSYLRCEIHNSTFGGNGLACAAALRTLEIVADPAFLASVRERGKRLFGALNDCSGVDRISSRGLLGGIHLRDSGHPWVRWENIGLPDLCEMPISGALLIERLFRKRILAQVCAHDWSVVRVEPPLTVSDDACARFVDAVGEAVRWLEENG